MFSEKKIKKMERAIGKQVVGRALFNVLERNSREISRKDFNKIVNRTIHFNSSDANKILDVLRQSKKVKVTQRKIRIV